MEFLDLPEIRTSLKSQTADWLQNSSQVQNPKTKEPKESKAKTTSGLFFGQNIFIYTYCNEPFMN